jgi:hypothetical protein
MNPPTISVSEYDMYRTRENETGSICDCCTEDSGECQRSPAYCEECAREDWGERQFEARRDES